MLTGKKTFIVGIGALLGAIGGALTGALPFADAIQLGGTALFGIFLRRGIAAIPPPRPIPRARIGPDSLN